MIRKLSLYLLLIASFSCWGCQCPELPFLTVEEAGNYEWISYGRIDGNLGCPEGEIKFTPVEIFKGEFSEEEIIFQDCGSDCIHDPQVGQYWIFYATKNNAQELKVSFCAHSRRQMPSEVQDYQSDISGRSFQEELTFLRANFKVKTDSGQFELKPKKYEKVDPIMVPILLGVGLVFMFLGYFFFVRRKSK